jgi:hypothetical protein
MQEILRNQFFVGERLLAGSEKRKTGAEDHDSLIEEAIEMMEEG